MNFLPQEYKNIFKYRRRNNYLKLFVSIFIILNMVYLFNLFSINETLKIKIKDQENVIKRTEQELETYDSLEDDLEFTDEKLDKKQNFHLSLKKMILILSEHIEIDIKKTSFSSDEIYIEGKVVNLKKFDDFWENLQEAFGNKAKIIYISLSEEELFSHFAINVSRL